MNPASIGKIFKEVIKWGPLIAKAGKEVYENVKVMFGDKNSKKTKPEEITLQLLDKKVNQLEQNDLDQAKLLSEISQQTNSLTELSKILASRINLIIIIACISFIISVYLLIKSFF